MLSPFVQSRQDSLRKPKVVNAKGHILERPSRSFCKCGLAKHQFNNQELINSNRQHLINNKLSVQPSKRAAMI